MSLKLRVASFNFENFFSRAILLNRDNATMAPFLAKFAQLQAEVERTTYNKPKILQLYKELKKYVTVRENKGKLLSGATGNAPKVVANGKDDWEGFLELKRERITDPGQENTLRVLKEVGADIVCVVEVEDRPTLEAAGRHDTFPAGLKYPHAMVIAGNDDRGINVGVLSRHPIGELVSHVDDKDATGVIFSRDCLDVQVLLPGGRTLAVLANHLKSQGYGSPAANDAKRLRQAKQVVQVLNSRYDLTKDYVIVAGDMNADRAAANGASIAPLTGLVNLNDILDTPAGDNWSYAYKGKKQRLDYLFCSKVLSQHLTGVGLERRGMADLSKLTGGAQLPFPEVKGTTTAASDHAAVYADFDLP